MNPIPNKNFCSTKANTLYSCCESSNKVLVGLNAYKDMHIESITSAGKGGRRSGSGWTLLHYSLIIFRIDLKELRI